MEKARDDGYRRFRIVAEILSAAAVVISLVFVGIEVRESARQTALNTESMQVSTYQDLVTQIGELNRLALENVEVAALLDDFNLSYDSMPSHEQRRYTSYLFLVFRHGDMAFYQYELGALSRERLESALRPLTCRLGLRMFQEFWQGNREGFVPAYRAFVDSAMVDAELC